MKMAEVLLIIVYGFIAGGISLLIGSTIGLAWQIGFSPVAVGGAILFGLWLARRHSVKSAH